MPNAYLDQILSGQAQNKITGRGALTGPQIEAAFQGDISARYQAEAGTRAEAAREAATERSLDIQESSIRGQKTAEMMQAGISSLGIAAYAGDKFGWFNKTPAVTGTTGITAPAATGAITDASVTSPGQVGLMDSMGYNATATTGEGATGIGAGTSALGVGGWVALGETGRQLFGAPEKAWSEKSGIQRIFARPGTEAAMPGINLAAKVFGDDSIFGKLSKGLANAEDFFMKPIDMIFGWL